MTERGNLDAPRFFLRLGDHGAFQQAEQQQPRKPPFLSRGNLNKYSPAREIFAYHILSQGGRGFVLRWEKYRISRAGPWSCRIAGQC